MRKYWFNSISGNIHRVIFKLGIINLSQKGSKMTPVMLLPWQQFCYWSFSNINWNSRIFSQQKSSTLKNISRNLFDNVGSTSVSIGTLSHTLGGCNLRYLFFKWKGTGAKYVAMTTKLLDSFCSLFDLNLLCQV